MKLLSFKFKKNMRFWTSVCGLVWLFNGCRLTGLCSISLDGTFSPRQRILKRLEEVEDAPANNHIIVEAHKATNLKREKNKVW